MKSSHFIFCLLMIVIFSCVQQDDNNSNLSLLSVEKNLNKGNIDISKYNNPISLEGNVKVWVNKNDELVAYTETDTHIHIFLLQYLQTKLSPKENFNSINFLDHSFSLISNSGQNILCEVNDKNESRLAGNDLKEINETSNFETILGGGIAHIWINKDEMDNSHSDFKYENLKLNNSVYDAFEKGSDRLARSTDCTSGGSGSTSCSISGCSVSCGSGYYACCRSIPFQGPSCKCISNTVIIEPE